MQIAMIGLGRMGASMVRRLLKAGHSCVVYARQAEAMASVEAEGAVGTASLAELVAQMATPRAIWLMIPAGAVDTVLAQLLLLADRSRQQPLLSVRRADGDR